MASGGLQVTGMRGRLEDQRTPDKFSPGKPIALTVATPVVSVSQKFASDNGDWSRIGTPGLGAGPGLGIALTGSAFSANLAHFNLAPILAAVSAVSQVQ